MVLSQIQQTSVLNRIWRLLDLQTPLLSIHEAFLHAEPWLEGFGPNPRMLKTILDTVVQCLSPEQARDRILILLERWGVPTDPDYWIDCTPDSLQQGIDLTLLEFLYARIASNICSLSEHREELALVS